MEPTSVATSEIYDKDHILALATHLGVDLGNKYIQLLPILGPGAWVLVTQVTEKTSFELVTSSITSDALAYVPCAALHSFMMNRDTIHYIKSQANTQKMIVLYVNYRPIVTSKGFFSQNVAVAAESATVALELIPKRD